MPIQNAAFKLSKEFSIRLPYTSYKPQQEREKTYPLILYLHGVGGTGNAPGNFAPVRAEYLCCAAGGLSIRCGFAAVPAGFILDE